MFGVHPDVFCLLLIILGRVGSGKSQFLLNLLIQILSEPQPFNVIIPDLKGKEYRNLLPYAKNLKIITREKFKINPLQVSETMTPLEHAMFFAKVFVRENYLMATSESILFETLQAIYKKRSVFDGSRNWPTLRDLFNVINYRLNTEKSFRYRDVLLGIKNRLDPYIYGEGFNCRSGIPYDFWRTENIVLEMGKGFTDNMYSFIVSFITGLRYNYNLEKGLVGSKLRTLLIVDEGRLLFRQRDFTMFGESYISEVSTRLRDPGVGLLVASHESSSFNPTIKAISHTKLCFPLTDGADVLFAKESFGLNDEQSDYLFRLPRFGQCIVRYGGYENPFLLAVPAVELNEIINDEEVNHRMADFYKKLNEVIEKPKSTKAADNDSEGMSPPASALLYFLGKNPFTKVSGMIKAPGFQSPASVNKALSWLEANGYMLRQSIRVSKRGRKSIFTPLTPKAYSYLRIKGPRGKGNFEHKLYQHLICSDLKENGWNVQIEGKIGQSQKVIDVLARSENGEIVAYEVTLHFENLIENIQKDIDSGVSEVVIVTRDKDGIKKARGIIDGDPSIIPYNGRITFSLISDFFP